MGIFWENLEGDLPASAGWRKQFPGLGKKDCKIPRPNSASLATLVARLATNFGFLQFFLQLAERTEGISHEVETTYKEACGSWTLADVGKFRSHLSAGCLPRGQKKPLRRIES